MTNTIKSLDRAQKTMTDILNVLPTGWRYPQPVSYWEANTIQPHKLAFDKHNRFVFLASVAQDQLTLEFESSQGNHHCQIEASAIMELMTSIYARGSLNFQITTQMHDHEGFLAFMQLLDETLSHIPPRHTTSKDHLYEIECIGKNIEFYNTKAGLSHEVKVSQYHDGSYLNAIVLDAKLLTCPHAPFKVLLCPHELDKYPLLKAIGMTKPVNHAKTQDAMIPGVSHRSFEQAHEELLQLFGFLASHDFEGISHIAQHHLLNEKLPTKKMDSKKPKL